MVWRRVWKRSGAAKIHFQNTPFSVDFEFGESALLRKEPEHHKVHPVFGQLGVAVFGEENGQVENGMDELFAVQERGCPVFKGIRPVALVFYKMAFAIPYKFELVVAEFIAVNTGQGLIKASEWFEVFRLVVFDFLAEGIPQLQWIMQEFVLFL